MNHEKMISTELYRPDAGLRLAGPYPGRRGEGVRAMLVVPHRRPSAGWRVVTFRDADGAAAAGGEAHAVAFLPAGARAPRCAEVADVLVLDGRGPSAVTAAGLRSVLAGNPGCAVAAACGADRCVTVVRDGPVVRFAGARRAGRGWPQTCGSFVYAWWAAGLAVASLAESLVLAGRLRPGEFEVAGGVTAVVTAPARTWRAAS